MEIFKNSLIKIGNDNATTSMCSIENVKLGPPPQYGGTMETLNPEELFVAAVNSCIMLVFYYFVNKHRVIVHSYQSNAEGTVEKTKDGLRFTKITINARVAIGDNVTAEKIQEISHLAEKNCLVSNSIACPVEYLVVLDA